MIPGLDPDSPTPLYHQIAEGVRYGIATGRLRPGDVLPSIREAAERYGVNLHTVRQAHQELARQGLVEIRRPQGAVILAAAAQTTGAARAFAERLARQAREKHGLSPAALAALILETGARPARARREPVHVIECSATQAEDLARQLGARYDVEARPWRLDEPGPLPEGPLVATYFHYNDLRRLAPERLASISFVAIHIDEALADAAEGLGAGARVWLVERDESMARTIAADVRAAFHVEQGALARAQPMVVERAEQALDRAGSNDLVLFAPRLWATLSSAQRASARAREARYVIDPEDMARLGVERRWPVRAGARGSERRQSNVMATA